MVDTANSVACSSWYAVRHGWHQLHPMRWRMLLIVGFVGLVALLVRSWDIVNTPWGWVIAEVIAPVCAAWLGATLLICDPGLELYATTPPSFRGIWLQRTLLCLILLFLSVFGCHFALHLPVLYTATLLITSFTAFMTASLLSSVLAGWIFAGFGVTILILGQLLFYQPWLTIGPYTRLFFFPLQTVAPDSSLLALNRGMLFLVGVLCCFLQWLAIGREEQLIRRWFRGQR